MGAAFCPTCGSSAAGATKFCSTCGENLERYEQIVRRSQVHDAPEPATKAARVGPARTAYGVPGPEASPEVRPASKAPPRGVLRPDHDTALGVGGPEVPREAPVREAPHRDLPGRMPEGVSVSEPPAPRPSSPGSLKAPPLGLGAEPLGSSAGRERAPSAPPAARGTGGRRVAWVLTLVVVVAVIALFAWDARRRESAERAAREREAVAAAPAPAPPRRTEAVRAPELSLRMPSRIVTDRDRVVVRGRVSGDAQLWVDGARADVRDGSFDVSVPLPTFGKRTLQLIARREGWADEVRETVEVQRVRDLQALAPKASPASAAAAQLAYRKVAGLGEAAVGTRMSVVGAIVSERSGEDGAFFLMNVVKCPPKRTCPLWVHHAGIEPIVPGRRVWVAGLVSGTEALPLGGEVQAVPALAADTVLPLGKR